MGLFDGTPLERPVLCDRCGKHVAQCDCPHPTAPDTVPQQQLLSLRIEKRKRGKTMTVIAGFSCSQTQMKSLLSELKNRCGAGGTQDGTSLEVQGEHLQRLREHLLSLGYRIR